MISNEYVRTKFVSSSYRNRMGIAWGSYKLMGMASKPVLEFYTDYTHNKP